MRRNNGSISRRNDVEIDVAESVIEDYIFNNPADFFGYYPDYLFRQFNLSPYGYADLVGAAVDPPFGGLYVLLVEIKTKPLSYEHIGQILRYKAALAELAKKYFKCRFVVDAHLLTEAPSRDTDLVYLCRELARNECINFWEYQVSLTHGIRFKEVDHRDWQNVGRFSKSSIKLLAGPVKDHINNAAAEFMKDAYSPYVNKYAFYDLSRRMKAKIVSAWRQNGVYLDAHPATSKSDK